jgi:hypothetical protein
LQQGPWKFLIPYIYALALQIDPWKEPSPRNWSPRCGPVAVRPISGEPVAVAGRSQGGEWPWGSPRLELRLGWGRGVVGELARRSYAAAAAGARALAKLQRR